MSTNNLYKFQTPKTGNEETNYFLTRGRITLTSFLTRSIILLSVFAVNFWFYFEFVQEDSSMRFRYFFEPLNLYVIPVLGILFFLIQCAKRIHDVNKSGWLALIPLYNIFLIFKNGSKGTNSFGIDPFPRKNIQYFDEINSDIIDITPQRESDLSKQKSNNLYNRKYLLFQILKLTWVAFLFLSITFMFITIAYSIRFECGQYVVRVFIFHPVEFIINRLEFSVIDLIIIVLWSTLLLYWLYKTSNKIRYIFTCIVIGLIIAVFTNNNKFLPNEGEAKIVKLMESGALNKKYWDMIKKY